MYIKEIILDGFKTYANRTVISGFDPNFNAVTGLNGSGKSNILDAICFVLGITNLSQVRVASLQELVYKQGQAGITKASVTVVFNNENPQQSPVGYGDLKEITVTRQVVIGGRNKYLINGHNAQTNRVQNLFHSVQLNVNNPHFLIMQGKINQVINMKPPEIRAMIEEAAGTRMFEMKKQNALKTIAKKEKKVEEIQKLLDERITPTLENLRKERAHYMKWTNNQNEIERISRFTIAFDYVKAQETLQTSSTDLEQMNKQLEDFKEQAKSINKKISKAKSKLAELTQQKEHEMSGDLKKMESTVNKLSKEVVKVNAELEYLQETANSEEKKSKSYEKNKQDVLAAIQQKEKDLDKVKKGSAKTEENNAKLSATMEELQRKYQALAVGMSSDAEGEKTLADQVMDAKRDAANAVKESKQAKLRIQHIESELKEKKKTVQTIEKGYTAIQTEYESSKASLSKINEALSKIDFNEEKERHLLSRKVEEEGAISKLSEKVDNLSAQLSDLQFDFSSPDKNFDRSKVKGLVATLIKVKNPSTSLALEVTAGGKLYNVVVDTEQTGTQLLKNGKLKRRVTIIPLNKISKKSLDEKVIKAAERMVGKENVSLGLSLVGYDHELESAMSFVFGSTLICKDSEIADKVTFNPEIRARSVTLEGDVFDPSGTLTGGSRPSAAGSVLARLQVLNETTSELESHKKELQTIRKQFESLRASSDKYKDLKKQHDLKAHEVGLLEDRIGQTSHYQLLETVKSLETQLKEEKNAIEQCKTKEEKATEEVARLENTMQNFQSHRDSHLKKIESEISSSKSKLQASTKDLKAKQAEIEQVALELAELQSELVGLEDQMKNSENDAAQFSKDLATKLEVHAKTKGEYTSAKQELDQKKENLIACDKEISSLISQRDSMSSKITDIDVETKKVEHKIFRFHKDKKDASKFVEHLEEKNPWISKEKQFFGKALTDYDFTARNPAEAQTQLNKLRDDQAKLSKQINKKVMGMFEKAEQEYKELMEKKIIIEKDKAKIEAVINELDEKKNEALSTTWQKVNKDFGSIFSTLLPGTSSKLEPPEGKTVLDGLEMKVAFGDVWKESLSELSGGQRSLLALSLILSLLLFKPAPMYILDEIDAALDLHHTQNIGQMLKAHFTHSQFIIVSLKDHMFNHANVLFRTAFVDGVSCVTRTRGTKPK